MKSKLLLVAALVFGLAVANAQTPTTDTKAKKEHSHKTAKDSTAAKTEKKATKTEKKAAEKKPATK